MLGKLANSVIHINNSLQMIYIESFFLLLNIYANYFRKISSIVKKIICVVDGLSLYDILNLFL